MWSEKFVKDNHDLAVKLEQLKASRAKDLDKVQEMTKLVRNSKMSTFTLYTINLVGNRFP